VIFAFFSVKTRIILKKNFWQVYFVTKVSLYLWNLRKLLRLLMYDKAGLSDIFSALIRCFTEKGHAWSFRNPMVTSKFFFTCFRYFYIKMNIFQGYSYSKYFFRQNRPTLESRSPLLMLGLLIKGDVFLIGVNAANRDWFYPTSWKV
jgi:hypothetical protein